MPAYKAGGPIQSINNLAKELSTSGNDIYVFCSNVDLDNKALSVQTDTWCEYERGISVYYASQSLSKKNTLDVINDIKPDTIFINGLYSLMFTIYPLLYKGKCRKVLSARGMLHPEALSQKSYKKKVFISMFKMLGLNKQCEYHATTTEESKYIKNVFGNDSQVWTVSNLPNIFEYHTPIPKSSNSVQLVSISLISPMKNILLVLKALKRSKASIIYDIYGPVKDAAYWGECLNEIKTLPENIIVTYKGEVLPANIQDTVIKYHYFILPSKSENFGHAIYEAMSAGRPVITSHNTPWNNLEPSGAGYNIDPEDTDRFTRLLEDICLIDNEQYVASTTSAKKYITEQYDINSIKEQYIKMFSS